MHIFVCVCWFSHVGYRRKQKVYYWTLKLTSNYSYSGLVPKKAQFPNVMYLPPPHTLRVNSILTIQWIMIHKSKIRTWKSGLIVDYHTFRPNTSLITPTKFYIHCNWFLSCLNNQQLHSVNSTTFCMLVFTLALSN